jgi:superfamily II DNA or RNA helicase
LFLKQDFWQLLSNSRVLVVFDEIHHCSGTSSENSNAWGEEIIQNIQHQATYTLALTGTPWRSDKSPIVLSNYANTDDKITCDYIYGLRESVNDGVCRNPKIVLIDNEEILVTDDENDKKTFFNFSDLLKQSKVPYSSIISNDEVIRHILIKGCEKLSNIRQVTPNAGALVVASSVKHAKWILDILTNELNQSAVLVTYKQSKPVKIIDNFRHSQTEWIVSVGMISEGTDIPRLQVCCHLSHVKTELYFRQVLGRILRVTNQKDQDAWLYTFAEPKLTTFANRVDIELPEQSVCSLEYFPNEKNAKASSDKDLVKELDVSINDGDSEVGDCTLEIKLNIESNIVQTFNYRFEMLGTYREQVIATFNSPF